MSIISLLKVNIFSVGKKLFESVQILAKLLLTLSVIPLYSLSFIFCKNTVDTNSYDLYKHYLSKTLWIIFIIFKEKQL